jgi:hypothetical protein
LIERFVFFDKTPRQLSFIHVTHYERAPLLR